MPKQGKQTPASRREENGTSFKSISNPSIIPALPKKRAQGRKGPAYIQGKYNSWNGEGEKDILDTTT